MGTWGSGPFDNDAATDWYLELLETSDLWLIEEVLDASIVNHDVFDFPDLGPIVAACEVVLGLLAPGDFERRANAGPKYVDPLVHGLEGIRGSHGRPGMDFAIPSQLVDWVKQHRHLDVKPLLASANTILNHVKASGGAYYDGYFLQEEAKHAWLSYVEDLHGRVGKAALA